MEIKKARKIVKAMAMHSFYQMEIIETPPPSLEEYGLEEMIEANRAVQEANRNSKSVQMVCDNRLIAALYTLYHYLSSPPDNPEIVTQNENKCLCVLTIEKQEKNNDGM